MNRICQILLCLLANIAMLHAQTQLEMSLGGMPIINNGSITVDQKVSFKENTAAGVFANVVPNITVTASLINQQYTNLPTTVIQSQTGMSFGGRVNSQSSSEVSVPVYNAMQSNGNPTSSLFTSNPFGVSGTGIDIQDNYGFYIYNSVYPLFQNNDNVSGTFYYGDLVLNFSTPVSNPVIHIVGLGANVVFSNNDVQGFSTELELSNNAYSLTKLSGSTEFDVTSNKIRNSASSYGFNCGNGAACGSVRVNGINISSIKFKLYVTGDGGGTAWSHPTINSGDEFIIGVSLNSPVALSGNVFQDFNGLQDNTVNGLPISINSSLYVNLIDSNGLVVDSKPVNSNGTYVFSQVGNGTYAIQLSTLTANQGQPAPAIVLPGDWVNVGENVGNGPGSDGIPNGSITVQVGTQNMSNINFGITKCININSPSNSQSYCVSANGSNISVKTSLASPFQIKFVKFNYNPVSGLFATPAELDSIYQNTNILQQVAPMGNAAPYTATYTWNASDFPNATNSPITYYVVAIPNIDLGINCRPYQIIKVTVNPLPVLNPIQGFNSGCINDSTFLSHDSIGGVWSIANNLVATITSSGTVFGLSAGNTQVTYTYTNVYGCSSFVTKPFTILSPSFIPAITANGVTTACLGAGLKLTSNLAPSYQWFRNGVAINGANSQSYTPVQSGIYFMRVNGSSGQCNPVSNSISVTINTIAKPTITAWDSLTQCAGNCVKLSSSSGYSSYQWYKNGVIISGANNLDYLACDSGKYQVIVSNGAGCLSDTADAVNVLISNQPAPTILPITGVSMACVDSIVQFSTQTVGSFWNSSDTNVATIDSTGKVVAKTIGYSNISYSVSNGACNSKLNVPFYVSCSAVSSGSTGGVESESLGDVIATRVYNKATQSKPNIVDYETYPSINAAQQSTTVFGNTTSLGTIGADKLLPSQTSIGLGFVIKNMSADVADLTSFTNAVQVNAFDYTYRGQNKATSFVTKTYGNVYSHTKPICDRLKDATLNNVSKITINGIPVLLYELIQHDGKYEYAMSFSVGFGATNSATVQSTWLTKTYDKFDTMYNFQLWAVNPEMLKLMFKNIIEKVAVFKSVVPSSKTQLPVAYIKHIERDGYQLKLDVYSNSDTSNAYVLLQVKNNEQSKNATTLSKAFTLPKGISNTVTINLQDAFESDIQLYINQSLVDMAYMNDGNWNYSMSNMAGNKLNGFSVTNDTVTQKSGELRLFRNVAIDAKAKDYVTIYKMMKAGGLDRDINAYANLLFKAQVTGAAKIRILLQKKSITDWNSQYAITIPVSQSVTDYAVRLSDFKNGLNQSVNDLSDVVTISFSFINIDDQNRVLASLSEVRFSKTDWVYYQSLLSDSVKVYPNPAKGFFHCSLVSQTQQKVELRIVEVASGKVVHTQTANLQVGKNVLDIRYDYRLKGFYVVQIVGADKRYQLSRVLFE